MTLKKIIGLLLLSAVANADTSSTRTLNAQQIQNAPGLLGINSSGTVTVPNATDTLVGKATTDSLTNKSLVDTSSFVVDSSDPTKKIGFNAGGTTGTSTTIACTQTSNRVWSLPDATSTAVGTDVVQTLTNKTLSGNTATNLVNGSGVFSFNSSGTVTAPNATDTLVGKATTDVLTNKTLSGNTASSLVNGSGTFNFNSSGSLTAPNATDTLVGKATTDVLTNKTLTGNTAVNLVSGSGTLVLNTTGTATIPNATDTLVGKATTDSLTNKSFVDSSTFVVDVSDATKKIAFDAAGSTATVTTFSTAPTVSRTWTIPDASSTAVGTDVSQTLSNKTIDAGSNTISNIANANISASAAIARSKLATGTADHVVINSGTGAFSSEANLAVSRGGTGTGTLTANNVILGNGTSAVQFVAPGSSGNVLTSNGTTWSSATPTSAPDQSYELSNVAFSTSVAANALTFSLKGKDGTDPSGANVVKIGFRSSTATSGVYVQRSVSAALSAVVSSGSTLGTANGVAAYLWLYALDNAGTVELAFSGTGAWDEGTLQSTTAEGGAGAADSVGVLYSTTARTNVAIRLIGRILISEATAGTWASNATELSPIMVAVLEKVPPKAQYRANSSTSMAANDYVNYNTKLIDTHNAVTTGTGTSWKFTAPIAGDYHVCTTIQASAGCTGTDIDLLKNDALGTTGRRLDTVTGAGSPAGNCTDINLAVGDYVSVRLDVACTIGNANNLSTISIHYLGP